MLPDLKGAKVLDLGCGDGGHFVKEALSRGAVAVEGVDISGRMIARANVLNNDERVCFRVDDLETIEMPDTPTYDLCHSTLVIHYVVAMERLLKQIHKSLKPGGSLVFTAVHPIATSTTNYGFKCDEDGPFCRVENYHNEGTRLSNFVGEVPISIQHRTMETFINTVITSGFRLDKIVEWTPTDQEIEDHPYLAAERIRPRFLIIRASKN
eukprot:gene18965-22702_t